MFIAGETEVLLCWNVVRVFVTVLCPPIHVICLHMLCVYICDNAVASLAFCLLVNGTPVPVIML